MADNNGKNIFTDSIIQQPKSPFMKEGEVERKRIDTSLIREYLEEKGYKVVRDPNSTNVFSVNERVYVGHGYYSDKKKKNPPFDEGTVKKLKEKADEGKRIIYFQIVGNNDEGFDVYCTDNIDIVCEDAKRSSEKDYTVKFLGEIEGTRLCNDMSSDEINKKITEKILNSLNEA